MSSVFTIQKSLSPNFSKGRLGYKPIAIVDHITAGAFPGCLSWLRNKKAQASAHYLVTKEGEIYQLVDDANRAWHCGRVNKPTWSKIIRKLGVYVNPNNYTIGIEHEGQPYEALTEEQYQATLYLHYMLCKRYKIPVTPEYIIGHYRIYSIKANCPGRNFPWERLFTDLKARGLK